MGGVSDSSVRESIRREQIAELIVPSRLWNPQYGDERASNRKHAGAHGEHGEPSPPRQLAEYAFKGLMLRGCRSILPSTPRPEDDHGGGNHQNQFDDHDQPRSQAGVKVLHR